MLTTGNCFLSTSSRGPAAASADDVHRPQTGGQHQTGETQEHTHTQSHSQRNTHRHTDTQTQKCSHTHTGTCSHTHTQTVFNPTETCSHTHGPNFCPPPPRPGGVQAVRLESSHPQVTRYMVVVSTNGRQDTEESLVLGMDFCPPER